MPVADLERGPKQVTWPITAAWLQHALEGTEASPAGEPGELTVEFTKNGPEIMARGDLQVALTMPCARTQEPVPLEVKSEIFLLLSPSTTPAAATKRPRRETKREATPAGKTSNKSAKAPPGKVKGGGWNSDPTLSDSDAAQDTYSGEEVVLDSFVREFILLELAMFILQKGLPFDEPVTIAGSSAEAPAERPLDPRLMPLIEIKNRLESKE